MLANVVNRSLRLKFFFVVLLIVSASSLISAAIIIRNESVQWQAFLQSKGVSLGAYLADISKDLILNKDHLQLDNIVKKINNDPVIIYAVIYDNKGRQLNSLYASVNLKMPLVADVISRNGRESGLPEVLEAIKRRHVSEEISVPIAMDQEVLGRVDIGLSKDSIGSGIRKTIYGILLGNMLSLLIAFLLISKLQNIIITPVINLVRVMAQVSQKMDYSLRAPVLSHDEIGVMAGSFNEMLEQIQKVNSEIQMHRKHLEDEVEKRTKELAVLNRKLNQEKDGLQNVNEELSRERAAILEMMHKLEETNSTLKSTQDQLLQSEKMATVGQLAAGVAHEINNPAGFVMSNLDVLRLYADDLKKMLDKYKDMEVFLKEMKMEQSRQFLDDLAQFRRECRIDMKIEDLPNLTRESLDGMRRIKRIVSDLRTFSHSDEGQLQPADVHEIIQSAMNIAWNEIKYKAEVVREYGEIPMILCYPQQLGQVFLNLFVNAVQAMSHKGKITVRTFTDKGMVVVEVADTGDGMTEEVRKRVFEPFYTTKPVGKGTGLGLSLAYNIIEKHHGTISVVSSPGQGATFIMRLPVEPPVKMLSGSVQSVS